MQVTVRAVRQPLRTKTAGSSKIASNRQWILASPVAKSRAAFLLLTVRTVKCHSYCVTQPRATRSQTPGTEACGPEGHVARARRSHQNLLRCNVERRSQELTSLTSDPKGVVTSVDNCTYPRLRP